MHARRRGAYYIPPDFGPIEGGKDLDMAKKRSRIVLASVLALALVAAMVTGCAQNNGTSGGTKTLKIGVHTSLTGDLADYGFTAQEGVKLANKATPEVTVGGDTYKIELVIKDDKMDPAESSIVAQSLVDAGVVAVIGCLTSGATNAAGPIYSDAGVVEITPSATRADLVTKGWKYFFRTCVGDNFQGAELAKWVQELGFKKVVIFDDSGDYSRGLADVVEQSLKGTTVATDRQSAKDTDTDFSAQITNIKAFAADCVVFTGYHKQAGILRKQMVETGLEKVQLMGGDGVKSDEIIAEAGGAANATGLLATLGGVNPADMPGYAKFTSDYKTATSKDPGPYAETNHDAYVAIVEAIKKADSVDPAKIATALKEVEVDGVMGTFTFNEKGEVALKGNPDPIQTIFRYKCDGKTWVEAK